MKLPKGSRRIVENMNKMAEVINKMKLPKGSRRGVALILGHLMLLKR